MIRYSARYAETYDEFQQFPGVERQIELVLNKAKTNPGSLIVDIGCGTGIYTLPLAKLAKSRIIGVDRSIGMLGQIQTKLKGNSSDVRLLQAVGEKLPLKDNSVDSVFISYVLHQVEKREQFISEVLRVLREGSIAILTSSHRQLRQDIVHRYFPGILKINLERFPPLPEVRGLLIANGFSNITFCQISIAQEISIQALIQRVQGKYISALKLLGEDEFQKGLEVFERKLRQNFAEGELIYLHSSSLITATKSQGIMKQS